MKYWIWICLELLIMFGTGVWIYFFPEEALAKGFVGFGLLWLVEECKEINRRNKMSENYTFEQNTGENQIEGGVVSISGSATKQYRPFKNCKELIEYWYDFTGVINCSPRLFMPTIWIKHKRYGTENLIIAFDNDNESIGGSCVFIQDIWVDMKELFDNFTFLDGSPCGKEE